MTSKLKCPVCQQELLCIGILHAQDNHTIWYCPKCATEKQLWRIANKELWRALIQAKQDLEISRKAMNQVVSMGAKNNICYHLKAKTVKSILGNALEQIEHKEQI